MPEPVTIERYAGLGIANVMARHCVDAAVVTARLGLDLPDGPRATFRDGATVVGTGPGAWLVLTENAAPDFAETLAGELAGLASVSDQSSGYVVHRVSGTGARTLLRRGAAIDVDPSVFTPGSAATTVIAHIGVILWQVDDRPAYHLATFRSFADDFSQWLDHTAASL